jgi:hypothetical protein
LIIWTANTKAVTRPASGAVRSSRSRRARTEQNPSPATATIQKIATAGTSSRPSLMCIATTSSTMWDLPRQVTSGG